MREFPIFSKRRFEMKPRPLRCYYFSTGFLNRAIEAQALDRDSGNVFVSMQVNLPHESCAAEADGVLVHFRIDDDKPRGEPDRVKVRIYSKHHHTRWHSLTDIVEFQLAYHSGKLDRMIQEEGHKNPIPALTTVEQTLRITAALSYVCNAEQGRFEAPGLFDDAPDPRPDRPILWVPKGDTIKYVRAPFRAPVQARDVQTGEVIRKREHAVRGFWRTLRSGNKVWVRAHTRGDPALGTVETHYRVD